MEKELTFELYQIKDALNLDDSSYIKLRTELRKKGVLSPPKPGKRAIFGKKALQVIQDYLCNKDKELARKFIVWFITKKKEWLKNQEEIKKIKTVDSRQVVFRQVMEQLRVGKETRKYRSLLQKLKGEGIAKVYGITGKQVTYINPTERFFKIVSQYLNVSPKKVAEAVERIENSNEVELIDYMTRIGAMPYYKHVYNYLRERNAVIKGKYVKIKKEAIAHIKKYLTEKKSPAAERITEAIPQTPATSQEEARPKTSHSELTQMERLVDIAFRKEKIVIRKILLSEARQHNPISLLSFPGMTWFFERDLIALAGENISQIVGLERDKKVYEFMVLNKPPEKSYIHTFNTTDHEFAKNPPNYIKPFNFVWLDYMGAFSWKKLETFEQLLKNRLFSLPATIALTFQAGLEYADVLEYYKKLTGMKPAGKGRKPDWRMIRLTALPMIYSRAANKYGVSCYKVIEREYVEPVKMCHHAPMVLLVLRLENKY